MRINDKSKREKDEIREYLRIRDGTLCQIDYCMSEEHYREKTGKDFDIHHLDENPDNWDIDNNLCLAAHGCNVRETPHGKIDHEKNFLSLCNALKQKKVKSILTQIQPEEDGGLRARSAEYMKSIVCKPIMEEELERILDRKKEEEKNELIDSLSNASSLSPEVCRKWLRTWCNGNNGHLEEFDKDLGGGEFKKYIRRRKW